MTSSPNQHQLPSTRSRGGQQNEQDESVFHDCGRVATCRGTKLTVREVYKGDLKPGDRVNYSRVGGTVIFDEYWSSLNQQQRDKILHLNNGQRPTAKKYIQKKVLDDVDIEAGKE